MRGRLKIRYMFFPLFGLVFLCDASSHSFDNFGAHVLLSSKKRKLNHSLLKTLIFEANQLLETPNSCSFFSAIY
ncbi:hypothetical protein BD560DRAFT_408519 [Blakeslea trispora]|nr:hypothetical protein BD560DRAFT_408519 [Blakeslea trispora]